MNLTLFANLNGLTGFNKHARELSIGLNKVCNLKIIGEYNSSLPRELKDCFDRKDSYDNLLTLAPPYYWTQEHHNYKRVIGYGIFEGSKIPIGWSIHAKEISKIIVPSTHTKNSFINAGVKESKVSVVPHGVRTDIYKKKGGKSKNIEADFKGYYKYLFVGGWSQGINDRKGAQFLIKAFSEEFKKDEKVILIMKYNSAYSSPEQINNFIKSLKLPEEHAQIIQIFDNLSEEELANLYRSCDTLVSPHMSEAWGMNISESIACGTPVIATNYGGNTDYMKPLLSGKLVPSKSTPVHYYNETLWMEPNVKQLKDVMRRTFNGNLVIKCDSSTLNSWDETAKKIIEVIEE